jgi:hypothetical protein
MMYKSIVFEFILMWCYQRLLCIQTTQVCGCDRAVVSSIEKDFKEALSNQNSLEQWAVWLELVVDRSLAAVGHAGDYGDAARQFLLKWSFYRYLTSVEIERSTLQLILHCLELCPTAPKM